MCEIPILEIPIWLGLFVDLEEEEFRALLPDIPPMPFAEEEGYELLEDLIAWYKAGGKLFYTHYNYNKNTGRTEMSVEPIELATLQAL